MASNDGLIIMIAVLGGVAVAYATNAGGFKTWLDNAMRGGASTTIVRPTVESLTGGGTKNCFNIAGNTVWKSSGCMGGRVYDGLEYAVPGTNKCDAARTAFVKKYACPGSSSFARAYPAQDITVS